MTDLLALFCRAWTNMKIGKYFSYEKEDGIKGEYFKQLSVKDNEKVFVREFPYYSLLSRAHFSETHFQIWKNNLHQGIHLRMSCLLMLLNLGRKIAKFFCLWITLCTLVLPASNMYLQGSTVCYLFVVTCIAMHKSLFLSF